MLSQNNVIRNNKSGETRMISGVMLLTVSTLICKIIGLLFKIPIINIVGIDGMAYFSSAYNIYMLMNSIAAAGLPVALSILVSRNRARGNYSNLTKIFNISMCLFLALGLAGTAVLYFGAESYSIAIGMAGSSAAVKAIAPTLLFICISGAIRGYFQGYEIMFPTAVSQIIEAVGKLALGVGFASYCVNIGMNSSKTAAAAVTGLSSGVLISVIYLIIHLFIFKKKQKLCCELDLCNSESNRKILYDLFVIAFPITLSSCITSLTSLADTALITNRLVYGGFSTDAAVSLYSSYTNLAIPLFNLPPALITSIGISLIPTLSSSIAKGDEIESKKTFSVALRLCCMLALPASAGLAVFAKPILLLLYPSEVEACTFAAPLLSVLSAAIVFTCLITVCNSTLQAYMKTSLPIVSMAIGAAVKIAVEYILVGSNFGIYGAPVSTLACTFTILLLDLLFVTIYTPQRFAVLSFAKTFAATAVAIGFSAVIYRCLTYTGMGLLMALILSICVAVLMYSLFVLLFKVVSYSDIAGIGYLRPIAVFLKKYKLISK